MDNQRSIESTTIEDQRWIDLATSLRRTADAYDEEDMHSIVEVLNQIGSVLVRQTVESIAETIYIRPLNLIKSMLGTTPNLQQVDTINQASSNAINQLQASEHELPAKDDVTADLATLKEKQYFSAYLQAIQQGSCKNKIIRAMCAGPECVGKSSIMRVFTQQQLAITQDPTQIADQSDKMVYLKIYKIKDRTTHNLRQVWDNNIHQIVQDLYEIQINGQQLLAISTLTRGLIDQNLTISDQHLIASLQSAITNSHDTATALASSPTVTLAISPTDKGVLLQQYREFFQYYYPSWLNKATDDSQYAKIWDFGGHSIYHVTHQPFLSGNSIYILVFNISRNIHDKVRTRNGRLLNITYLQSMQEWLTSIIGGNACQDKMTATIDNDQVQYSLPIVILVASHGDYMTDKQQGIDRFIQFERELRTAMPCYKSNIYSSRIIFNCNPQDDSDVTLAEREQCSLHLHEIMKSFVQSLPFMRNPIPIRWYIMATILHTPTDSSDNEVISSFFNRIRDSRVQKIMTIKQIQSLAQDFGLYEGDDELIAMLSYLHDLGEVIFCRKVDECGIIVTDVDWLLRIFRAIIQLHDCVSGSLEIKSLYEEACLTGKISTAYINHVLTPYQLDDEVKKSIIKLMETYDILCTIKSDNDQDQCHYFVPYLLQPDVKPFDLSQYHVSEILYIGYEHNVIPYIPDGIYYCLLSSCLKEWNNTDVKLYYQCAKYYLKHDHHYIIIKKSNSHIAVQYCYKRSQQPEIAQFVKDKVKNSIFVKRPHELIKTKLSSIVDDRMPKFKGAVCQYYVQCYDCQQLISLYNTVESPKNWIQCLNCDKLFESQSINDWIVDREESSKEINNQRTAKLTSHNNSIYEKQHNQQELNMNTNNQDPAKYFYDVASKIHNDWKKLANKLDHNIDIYEIEADHTSVYDRAYHVLYKWKQNNHATIDQLLEALRKIRRLDIADAITNSNDK